MHNNKVNLFWGKAFPLFYYLCRVSDISAVGTIFNVFSYGAADALRVTPQTRFWLISKGKKINYIFVQLFNQ